MRKEIPKKGYRTLAIVWTLAAASMAMALVRRLPEFNLALLLLLVISTVTAASFWRTYHRIPERKDPRDPFDQPPTFRDDPELFDEPGGEDWERFAPPPVGSQLFADEEPVRAPRQKIQDSEEKNHER